MIQEGIKTANYREITKWNEVVQGGINAEILVVGSSRALVHFDCEYIEKVSGKSCYNLGFDGTTYPLQKLMLKLYLDKNEQPKEIIWSLDFHSFSDASNFYGFEQLIPYLSNYHVKEMLSLHKTPYYQFFIPIFRYSYNPKMKIIGLYSFLGNYSRKPILKKGYRYQDKVWDSTFINFVRRHPHGKDVAFERAIYKDFEIISYELNSMLNLTWILTPYYYEAIEKISNRGKIKEYFINSSDSLNISFYDMSNNSISKNKNLFYNGSHMNQKGVNSFMKILFYTN